MMMYVLLCATASKAMLRISGETNKAISYCKSMGHDVHFEEILIDADDYNDNGVAYCFYAIMPEDDIVQLTLTAPNRSSWHWLVFETYMEMYAHINDKLSR